jgi:hypothetical protein
MNPLFAKTDGFTAAPGWGTPPPVQEEPVPVVLQITSPPPTPEEPKVVQPTMQQLAMTLPKAGQPSIHDMRSDVPYDFRYKKDNVQVDRRLWTHWIHLIKRSGYSKTDAFNRLLIELLVAHGYEIDPDLLDTPTEWKDIVPPK